METEKSYNLTEKELQEIIDYIRAEARLSYNLRRILWLMEEGNRVRKETLDLAMRFRNKKQNLRKYKEIYKYLVEGDDVDTKFPQARLKKKGKQEKWIN